MAAQNTYAAPQRPHPQAAPPAASRQNPPPLSYTPSSVPTSQKPRPKSRSFSFRSDRPPSNHQHKVSSHETSEEKEAKRLHSKADPTLAMNEAEPSAVAAGVKSSLAPLRSIQHKDSTGNPIADPDKSNPTRSRWERPLDTIRGFEAAIDGAYSVRRSYVRPDSDSAVARPKSHHPPRFPQDSYYGNTRPNSFRPDSQLDPVRQQRDSYMDGQQHPSGAYHPGNRQRYSRTQTEPGPSGYNNGARPGESSVYPLPNNHRSYETVASGGSGGSSGGEASGYTTDPTSGSENSSINRNGSPAKPAEPMNDYGINFSNQSYQPPAQTLGFNPANGRGPSPSYNRQGGNNYAVQPPQQQQQQLPQQTNQQQEQQRQYVPAVPRENVPITRKPMQISTPAVAQPTPSPPEKRKSWFKRRFSKNS